jgi:hypothetical protein
MSSEMGLIVMPTPFSCRKAVSSTPLCEGMLGSPESLARGMLTKGFPVNPGELAASPLFGHLVAPNPKPPGLRRARVASERSERPSNGVSCCQGKPEAQARAVEQSYDFHSTVEGGEPQGSRKGRPRYPLEGRDEQVDASMRDRMHETRNSGRHVKWN